MTLTDSMTRSVALAKILNRYKRGEITMAAASRALVSAVNPDRCRVEEDCQKDAAFFCEACADPTCAAHMSTRVKFGKFALCYRCGDDFEVERERYYPLIGDGLRRGPGEN